MELGLRKENYNSRASARWAPKASDTSGKRLHGIPQSALRSCDTIRPLTWLSTHLVEACASKKWALTGHDLPVSLVSTQDYRDAVLVGTDLFGDLRTATVHACRDWRCRRDGCTTRLVFASISDFTWRRGPHAPFRQICNLSLRSVCF